mmetsp:Transcript_39340/g.117694  ORF Transcript_39340/g.117694 Transcript_39340/m.117694 type:complete len:248 (+) Transcript_39340:148-891(+)
MGHRLAQDSPRPRQLRHKPRRRDRRIVLRAVWMDLASRLAEGILDQRHSQRNVFGESQQPSRSLHTSGVGRGGQSRGSGLGLARRGADAAVVLAVVAVGGLIGLGRSLFWKEETNFGHLAALSAAKIKTIRRCLTRHSDGVEVTLAWPVPAKPSIRREGCPPPTLRPCEPAPLAGAVGVLADLAMPAEAALREAKHVAWQAGAGGDQEGRFLPRTRGSLCVCASSLRGSVETVGRLLRGGRGREAEG